MSNKLQGRRTFDGHSLHDVNQSKPNPYQEVGKQNGVITKTRLYNFDPLKPHFYIVKNWGLQG